jgi:hypothetical protein
MCVIANRHYDFMDTYGHGKRVSFDKTMKKKPTDAIVKASKPKRTAKGPEPERLKIEGGWIQAVDHTLKVKRPASGWPK